MCVGGVKRSVRVKGIDAHEPGTVAGGFDKFNGAVRTPGGLVVLGIHVGAIVAVCAVFFCLKDVAEVSALFGEPVGVLVANSDALIVRVAIPEFAIPIVNALFLAVPGRGEVEFAR